MKKPYYNQKDREKIKEGKTLRAAQMKVILAFALLRNELTSSFPGSIFRIKRKKKVILKNNNDLQIGYSPKFRVWATSNEHPEGKMYYSDFLLNQHGDLIKSTAIKTHLHGYTNIWARISYNQINIMLFSEVCSNDGKEIYHGDVVYIAGEGNVLVKFPFFDLYERIYTGDQSDIQKKVGNIYENPELIKLVNQ
jgi:hypothetical protein